MTPLLTPRPYQSEAVAAFEHATANGLRRPLIVLPTAAGKTVLFLLISDRWLTRNPSGRVLVQAHTAKLVVQPEQRFAAFFGDQHRTGVISASAKRYEYDAPITFAGKDTLASDKHMSRYLANGAPGLIITDECHHAISPSYQRVMTRFESVNPALLHLGVTATPERGDGKGLGDVFDHRPGLTNEIGAVYSKSLLDLIKEGYLTRPRWLAIKTGISLDGVGTRAGDYVQSGLKDTFETPEVLAYAVKAYRENASGRTTMAFTISVAGAHLLAEMFRAEGYDARAIDGTMDEQARREVDHWFDTTPGGILCNCLIYTEGYDNPAIDCLIMCRPTKSKGLYMQMLGRGLRPSNGQGARPGEDCLVLQMCATAEPMLEYVGFMLGIPPAEQAKLKRTQAALDAIDAGIEIGDVEAGFAVDAEGHIQIGGVGIDALSIITMELDFIRDSPYTWHRDDQGYQTLGLGPCRDGVERVLVISPISGGAYTLYGLGRQPRPVGQKEFPPYQVRALCSGPLDVATARATEVADRWAVRGLATKGRRWHGEPMSEGQAKMLRRLMHTRKLPQMTAGDASQAITHLLALEALRTEGIQ